MRLPIPLYGRALSLLAINLLLLAVLLIGSTGWDSLLSDAARAKLTRIGSTIAAELSINEQDQWPTVLARYSREQGLSFRHDGPKPPPETAAGAGPPPDGPAPTRGPGLGPGFGPNAGGPGDRLSVVQSSWRGPYRIAIPEVVHTAQGSRAVDIVASTDSLPTLIRFLGVAIWLRLALLALGLSALLWVPFFLGMARSIRRVQRATERIASGSFTARVDEQRGDEIGALAGSVNDMAARLERLVSGQKQFLADVAHETISPLARIQLGLSLLESRVDAATLALLADVQDDAAQMADLLNELLLFSRADIEAERRPSEPVPLRACVLEAADREDIALAVIDIAPMLRVLAQPAMLARAVGNLIRNARRHGGDGPIEARASANEHGVALTIRDHGPGVPEALLSRLGELLFRADASRNRQSGGHGLGLAIVRRCIGGCAGELRFRNHPEGGFEAEVRLRVPPENV